MPDLAHGVVSGVQEQGVITPNVELCSHFFSCVQRRGAEIIVARDARSEEFMMKASREMIFEEGDVI